MIPVVDPEEMRRVDAGAIAGGQPIESLIERAGWAVALTARRMLGGTYGRRVVVVAGPGNNGADGRVAARLLRDRGVSVRVFAVDELPAVLPDVDLLVDAAFGTGFRGEWNPPPAPCRVLAVDIPSGVDGKTGIAHGSPWTCERTVTFVAPKPGLFFHDGRRTSGHIDVIDVGIDVSTARTSVGLVTRDDVETWLPRRASDAHKWSNSACIVAGSPGMTGAARLASSAAMRSGAGIVHLVSPGVDSELDVPTEVVRRPVCHDDWAGEVLEAIGRRFRVLAVGPGLGRSPATSAEVRRLVAAARVPLVVDGDALHAFDPTSTRHAPTILTPHDGEFAALTGSPPSDDRIESARDAARRFDAVVLLKGATTVVAEPSGRVALVVNADERLATAGSGDVLTGTITGLVAAGAAPFEAASTAAWLCAEAARRCARHGVVAGDLVSSLPVVIDDVLASTGQNDR